MILIFIKNINNFLVLYFYINKFFFKTLILTPVQHGQTKAVQKFLSPSLCTWNPLLIYSLVNPSSLPHRRAFLPSK